jgi:hypothetical protein
VKKVTQDLSGPVLCVFDYGRCEKTNEITGLHSKIQHFCAGGGKNIARDILAQRNGIFKEKERDCAWIFNFKKRIKFHRQNPFNPVFYPENPG